MIKYFMVFIIFLLSINIVYSVELDELIELYSYDTNHSDYDLNLISYSEKDNNITFEILINATPSEYDLYISLNNSVKNVQINQDYNSQLHEIKFDDILNGRYDLQIMLEDYVIKNYKINKTTSFELEVDIINYYDEFYVLIKHNLDNVINTKLYIESGSENLYESKTSNQLNSTHIRYRFELYEDSTYNAKNIELDDFDYQLDSYLGKFNFSIVKDIKEEKTDEGLVITFKSNYDNFNCFLLDEFNELIYNENIKKNKFVIKNKILLNSSLNGPYLVNIYVNNLKFNHITDNYSYLDFNVTIDDIDDTNNFFTKAKNKVMSLFEFDVDTDKINISDEIKINGNKNHISGKISKDLENKSDNINLNQKMVDKINNLITGNSIKNINNSTDFFDMKQGLVLSFILIIVIGIVLFRKKLI